MAFPCYEDYRSAPLTIVRMLPMSDAHNVLITEFYTAFQSRDAEAMAACYTDDVVFSDPAFGELFGKNGQSLAIYHHHHDPAHDLHGAVVDDPATPHTHVHGDSCKHG